MARDRDSVRVVEKRLVWPDPKVIAGHTEINAAIVGNDEHAVGIVTVDQDVVTGSSMPDKLLCS